MADKLTMGKLIVLSGGPADTETYLAREDTMQFQVPVQGAAKYVGKEFDPRAHRPGIAVYRATGAAHNGYEVFVWDPVQSSITY